MQELRVFVIDNAITFKNTLVQELTKRLPAGTKIGHAAQPAEALDKMGSFKPNVIVINFALGSLMVNQEKFLPLLTKKFFHVPIVTYGMSTGQSAAKILGAAVYLKKPTIGQSTDEFFDSLIKSLLELNSGKIPATSSTNSSPSTGNGLTRKSMESTITRPSPTRPIATPPPPVSPSSPTPSNTAPPTASRTATPPPEPVINIPTGSPGKINLIAMGASTGGTEALSVVLTNLSPPLPGIVIVQHIPPMFSKLFSERLNEECKLSVKEAATGDIVQPNHVYVAPGGKHMTIRNEGGRYTLECKPGPPVHSVCPAVDVLFDSVAEVAGGSAMGVILTGIGKDGASGLLKMRRKGSPTIGQNAATCIVYGMPKTAYEIGAVQQQLPLTSISAAIHKIAR